ncbi:rCG58632 [Rattus norvegicus]|uniref:RCG58632 n=1 Tax=Rattus norvegicus TaxID=10116 RepID=A6KR80_RAT|nr:ring finger protein 39, isoform CRA_b [Rattus norvegicus]EDL84610.1 rCG58632 [Rattus norvegicus]
MMAAHWTCSSPSRRRARSGSVSSHCSALVTPAPHCVLCQEKPELQVSSSYPSLVWMTSRLLLFGAVIPTYLSGLVCAPIGAGVLISTICPLILSPKSKAQLACTSTRAFKPA